MSLACGHRLSAIHLEIYPSFTKRDCLFLNALHHYQRPRTFLNCATNLEAGSSVLSGQRRQYSATKFGHNENYYAILGVLQNASDQEIKSAFLRRAKEFHPDVNKHDPDAKNKFIKIKEAYEILSNTSKRTNYDSMLRCRSSPASSREFTSRSAENNYGRQQQTYRRPSYGYARTRSSWNRQHAWQNDIDSTMRWSVHINAHRKQLEPYFNSLLVASLIALGCSVAWFQLQSRSFSENKNPFYSLDDSDESWPEDSPYYPWQQQPKYQPKNPEFSRYFNSVNKEPNIPGHLLKKTELPPL
ncbi:uncharacterized protein LOC126316930 [Schistocerca gregaria]|uniref:uncharacterized protein LOC126316930 n=1 Tax=Schistocerca gregaria TaxID=7010 RepID=UPI00211EC3E9|nr:uncharacterized protein LOC126316930 [Schistocerca gregaria]